MKSIGTPFNDLNKRFMVTSERRKEIINHIIDQESNGRFGCTRGHESTKKLKESGITDIKYLQPAVEFTSKIFGKLWLLQYIKGEKSNHLCLWEKKETRKGEPYTRSLKYKYIFKGFESRTK